MKTIVSFLIKIFLLKGFLHSVVGFDVFVRRRVVGRRLSVVGIWLVLVGVGVGVGVDASQVDVFVL